MSNLDNCNIHEEANFEKTPILDLVNFINNETCNEDNESHKLFSPKLIEYSSVQDKSLKDADCQPKMNTAESKSVLEATEDLKTAELYRSVMEELKIISTCQHYELDKDLLLFQIDNLKMYLAEIQHELEKRTNLSGIEEKLNSYIRARFLLKLLNRIDTIMSYERQYSVDIIQKKQCPFGTNKPATFDATKFLHLWSIYNTYSETLQNFEGQLVQELNIFEKQFCTTETFDMWYVPKLQNCISALQSELGNINKTRVILLRKFKLVLKTTTRRNKQDDISMGMSNEEAVKMQILELKEILDTLERSHEHLEMKNFQIEQKSETVKSVRNDLTSKLAKQSQVEKELKVKIEKVVNSMILEQKQQRENREQLDNFISENKNAYEDEVAYLDDAGQRKLNLEIEHLSDKTQFLNEVGRLIGYSLNKDAEPQLKTIGNLLKQHDEKMNSIGNVINQKMLDLQKRLNHVDNKIVKYVVNNVTNLTINKEGIKTLEKRLKEKILETIKEKSIDCDGLENDESKNEENKSEGIEVFENAVKTLCLRNNAFEQYLDMQMKKLKVSVSHFNKKLNHNLGQDFQINFDDLNDLKYFENVDEVIDNRKESEEKGVKSEDNKVRNEANGTEENVNSDRLPSEFYKNKIEALQDKLEECKVKMEDISNNISELQLKVSEQENLIEPYKNELQAYKIERNLLLGETNQLSKEIKGKTNDFLNVMGHQNKMQKIRHVPQLQEKYESLLKRNEQLKKEEKANEKILENLFEQYREHFNIEESIMKEKLSKIMQSPSCTNTKSPINFGLTFPKSPLEKYEHIKSPVHSSNPNLTPTKQSCHKSLTPKRSSRYVSSSADDVRTP